MGIGLTLLAESTKNEEDIASSVLAVRGLTKRFRSQAALDSVDLTLPPGEVHALLGENGSGKSTLIKILSGLHVPDGGSLFVLGKQVPFLGPEKGPKENIAFVHQDLGLIQDLSVAENLLLSSLSSPRSSWRTSQRQLQAKAVTILDRYEVEIRANSQVSSLAPLDRAMLAIVRALSSLDSQRFEGSDWGVLVLDEPTVFLPHKDAERLFELVRRVASNGASVLFVSHDLDEVFENCDRATVLRNGRLAGRLRVAETNVNEIVSLMVGRDVAKSVRPSKENLGDVLVDARNISGEVLTDVDLQVRSGEIVGVTGLAGSGFDELLYLLYGAKRARSGQMRLGEFDAELVDVTPRSAIAMGMVLVPNDRRRYAIVGSLSVTDNIMLPRLGEFSERGFISPKRLDGETRSLMDSFDIRPRDPSNEYGFLSGGNQQKGVLAKWLSTDPKLILLDEPTQGVDIGAREQIYELIRAAAKQGSAVICASTDSSQLVSICHRVIVLRRGSIVAELEGENLTKSQISESCVSSGSFEGSHLSYMQGVQ